VTCPGQSDYCDCAGDCTGQAQWCACDEAQECCRGATPTVLCPDQPKENYCDCEGDCKEQPAWCACTEARTCCSDSTNDGDDDRGDTDEGFLQLAFNRYSGSDASMDHEEWNVFVRELKLLSCDDATMRPGVKLVLKDGGDNYADCDGEYPLLFGEQWNGHEVYVNKTNDRILMFRWGSWLVTGYHWWPEFKQTGGEGMGGGFQSSELGATSSIRDSKWTNYEVIPIQIRNECEKDYVEKNRTDSIWYDINKSFFSYDHFLTALGRVALDRKENDQDRNTISDIHRWIAQNHADEEHNFCHNVDNDEGMSRSIGNDEGMSRSIGNDEGISGSISMEVFDVFMMTAIVFACGLFAGIICMRYSSSANNNSFTPIKTVQ